MMKRTWFFLGLLLPFVFLICSCKGGVETAFPPTQLFPADTLVPIHGTTLTPAPSSEENGASPTPADFRASLTPQDVLASETPGSQEAYPVPMEQPGQGEPEAYPGAQQNAYPLPQQTSEEPFLLDTPTPKIESLLPSTNPSATPITSPIATEFVPQPFGFKVTPSTGRVSILHSWTGAKFEALMQIIKSFQDFYPDIIFDLTYVPQPDLLSRYTRLAYEGTGPALLLGSSDWRASLANQALVEDLTPYISTAFKETYNPVALVTGQHKGKQVCLPYDLRGVLLYRNRKLISVPSSSFEELVTRARSVNAVGSIGAYFEGGSYFSLGHYFGFGGELLDQEGRPVFDRDQYQAALAWLDLLKTMRQAGAFVLNGNQDLELFQEGRSGLLVEGSWNREVLAQAIGAENLVIDPWPTYRHNRLSGFVQSDCVYLNFNTRELSSLDHQAALKFMGYFLTPPSQNRLAEVGVIPVLRQAQPTNPLIQQAMRAFQGGVVYPAEFGGEFRQIYFTALDGVIESVVIQGQDPQTALKAAFAVIQDRISKISAGNP